ncbi:MAG: nucleotidyltransferase family protein [Pseudomonadota bacterium]
MGILLAAGTSSRFGAADKLLHPVLGKPMISHAADALRAIKLDETIAIVRAPEVAAHLLDFDCIDVSAKPPSMARSLKAGIEQAIKLDADKVLIHLGDMPFVTPSLLEDIIESCRLDAPSVTKGGQITSPPTCFPRKLLDQLMEIDGDRGARELLNNLPNTVEVNAAEATIADVDKLSDIRGL